MYIQSGYHACCNAVLPEAAFKAKSRKVHLVRFALLRGSQCYSSTLNSSNLPAMRLLPALAGLVILPLAVADIEFVNPPLPRDSKDFSENPVYEVGSSLDIVWTPAPDGVPVSVVMWQEDIGNEGFSSELEDIVRT